MRDPVCSILIVWLLCGSIISQINAGQQMVLKSVSILHEKNKNYKKLKVFYIVNL